MKTLIYILILFLFITNLSADGIFKVGPIPGKVNTNMQEFGPSITPDGKTMYFYSKRNDSQYTNLYKTILVNGKWIDPIELKDLNSPYDDQSPFIMGNEYAIVFSSNRDGSIEFKMGNGKIGVSRDLYYSEYIDEKWAKPVPLSPVVNSEEMEENPYLHGNDLYFTRYPFGDSSRARIMRSRIIENEFTEPEELPAPINMPGYSNIAAVISRDGKEIYFSSNRPGGYGGYDIYRAKIKEDGTYTEAENLGPEINTEGNEAYLIISPFDNSLLFCRKELDKSYDIYTAIEIQKDDFISVLKVRKKLTLNNINFDVNLSELKPESLPILDKIADYLLSEKDKKMKITGHTDLTGDLDFNQQLSVDRAESVKNYLVKKGVNKNRLITEGKGSTQPLIPNKEKESNRMNRRTEFQLTE